MKCSPIVALLLAAAPFAVLLPKLGAAPASEPTAYHLSVETAYATLPRHNPENIILKVGLTPERGAYDAFRPPIHLAIALDRSGSMSGEKIEMARRAALQAFQSLRPDDRIAIIAYSKDAEVILPMTRVSHVSEPRRYIDRIEAYGNTAIYAGVNLAAAELRRESATRGAIQRIVLLSDGLANEGPSSTQDFRLLGQALSREDIAVSTVGLGLDYNEDLMAGLAQGGQGNVYFAENPRDLPRIFDSELGDASSLVAQDAVLEIECLPGFQPLRIIGREGRIDGQRVTIEISQLYAGREKYALIECAVAGNGDRPHQAEFARVRARLHDLRTERELTLDGGASVRFSDDAELCRSSVNLEVQRQVVENRIALAQDKAIELADRGDAREASVVINNLNTWITTNNAVWNDETIASQSASLTAQAKAIEENGVDKRARKSMRTSSYQSRSQQSYK